MYINDVHILTYIVFILIGIIVGQFVDWMNKRFVDNKKIFSKDIVLYLKKDLKINYATIISTAILYVVIVYRFGIKNVLLENLDLIKYLILVPILISIIIIDYSKKIIPNRLTLTLFEVGIVFTFLYNINNLFIARDYLIGMIIGAFIFGIIALLGRLIAGKEAMGMGDIKLIATLGLFFGTSLIISICIISFVVAAIFSIALLLRKNNKEYITFGPCISLTAILCIIIPEKTIISALLTIFTLGRYKP